VGVVLLVGWSGVVGWVMLVLFLARDSRPQAPDAGASRADSVTPPLRSVTDSVHTTTLCSTVPVGHRLGSLETPTEPLPPEIPVRTRPPPRTVDASAAPVSVA